MSAYLGRSGLDQLREALSQRDLHILASTNQHRFLTTAQIRALHFAEGTEAGAERTCRRTLTRLARARVLTRLERRVGGARDIVKPDVYVLTGTGDYEDAWFLEVDRGTESPAAVARKCRAYDRYWRTGREQSAHGSFPITIWICPDERRSGRIERIIGAARNLNRDLFRITTGSGLLALLQGGAS
jgi:hypothetical protein